jgi:hypothetical protein
LPFDNGGAHGATIGEPEGGECKEFTTVIVVPELNSAREPFIKPKTLNSAAFQFLYRFRGLATPRLEQVVSTHKTSVSPLMAVEEYITGQPPNK